MFDSEGLAQAFRFGAIFCLIVGIIVTLGINKGIRILSHSDDIESHKPIIPIKKLVVKNNKVDTLYIYQKPE